LSKKYKEFISRFDEMEMRDVFLCHASEDKAHVVTPLEQALQMAGISYWLDEAEINWGDSLTGKVNQGLHNSRFVMVVLSESFLGKHWPERELNAVLGIEASAGEVRVLPLLVGDKHAIQRIKERYPLINDKLYLIWTGDTKPVTEALLKKIGSPNVVAQPAKPARFVVPTTRIRKGFTDRDRDKFLEDSFGVIKNYFHDALEQLAQQDTDVETDYKEVNQLKVVASIYVRGELKNQCVIWHGSMMGGKQISYREGRNVNLQSDNSMNDWLHVEADDYSLYLKPSGLAYIEHEDHLDPWKGAEYLWRRFTQFL
jgi:hypothetical protein